MGCFMRIFLSLFLNATALYIVAQLFNSFYLESFGTALLASLVLSLLNVFVKPFIVILTLPLTIFTLGLFLFVINAITLMITQSLMGASFMIDSFWTAILAAIVVAVINVILNRLVGE